MKTMKYSKKPILTAFRFLLFLLILSGCASAKGVLYENAKFAANKSADVPIFEGYPPSNVKIIGDIQGYDIWLPASEGYIKRQMKREAARLGADAIVVEENERPFIGKVNGIYTFYTRIISGKMIAYLPDEK